MIRSLTLTQKVKVWEPPPRWARWIAFDADDEAWARPLGFGQEVERTCTYHFPRVLITEHKDGRITFTALPTLEMPDGQN